jgi:hypothetical protein
MSVTPINIQSLVQSIGYIYLINVWASSSLSTVSLVVSLFLRKASLAHAVLAASDDKFQRLLSKHWMILVVLPGLFVVATKQWGLEMVPPPHSRERQWADLIAVLIFFVWMNSGLLATSGLNLIADDLEDNPAMKSARAFTGSYCFLLGGVVGIVAVRMAGPLALYALMVAVIITIYLKWSFLRWTAIIRRAQSPIASDETKSSAWKEPFLLCLSDIHLTREGRSRTEGGPSGNANLNLLGSLTPTTPLPKYLIVTGDLVDTGEDAEWICALGPLWQLRRNGVRILLCPGNHDIATAYNPAIAYPFLKASDAGERLVDASRLLAYFRTAGELEPELACHDGKPVLQLREEETAPMRSLLDHWLGAVKAAISELEMHDSNQSSLDYIRKKGDEFPPRALDLLRITDPSLADALLKPLIDEAMSFFNTPEFAIGNEGREAWIQILTHAAHCHLDLRLLARRWARLWTAAFPLKVYVESDRIEFLIVNSISPEPGLIGSAFGRLTSEQLGRLRSCVAGTRAEIVVILMHHPIYGWKQEAKDQPDRRAVDIERWALLSHDLRECNEIVTMLDSVAPPHCKQVLLCGGHRHGVSRAGPVLSRKLTAGRLGVLESNALPLASQEDQGHSRTNDLLFCTREVSGTLQPRRVQLGELMRLSISA